VLRWDLNTKTVLRTFDGHYDHVQSLFVSLPLMRVPHASSESRKSEPRLVTSSFDKYVVFVVYYKNESPLLILFYCDSMNSYRTIKVWNIKTGECLKTLFGHEEGVWSVAADTLRIVSGAHDGRVIVWDMESGEKMYEIRGDSRGARDVELKVNCVTLSDTKIVVGTDDGTVRVFSFAPPAAATAVAASNK
jgi:F-box and WD-40 domain protein MET30